MALTTSTTVHLATLPNGITVITDSVPYVESITLGIQINAGSRDDPAHAAGLAHFMEHALFKGTRTRSYLDIARSVEQHGGYLDAYTTKEQTCVYLRCLAAHLEPSFELLADLVSNPTFPPEEMEKEKEVVLEEISSINDTPEELICEEFDQRSFPNHPIGNPILGTEKSVEAFSQNDLHLFLQQHYIPQKMVVTATGNVSHHAIMQLCERFLSHLANPAESTETRQPLSVATYKPFSLTLKKRIYQAQIVMGTAIERNDRHFYSLMVLNTLLGSGMSSLLNLELREKRGLAYNVYSSLAFFDDLTALNIYAGTDGNKVATTLSLIKELLQSDALHHPIHEELQAAKTKLLGSHLMQNEGP